MYPDAPFGAPIAQLDRAADYGSAGLRFNSSWVHHLFSSMAQAVSGVFPFQRLCGKMIPPGCDGACIQSLKADLNGARVGLASQIKANSNGSGMVTRSF